jgi:hypothetical protein
MHLLPLAALRCDREQLGILSVLILYKLPVPNLGTEIGYEVIFHKV